MSMEQAAKAPKIAPTACPVCGAPVRFISNRNIHDDFGAIVRFECGSADIIRAGLHWPQEAKDAAPPCLYIKGLRERLAALLGATEATA